MGQVAKVIYMNRPKRFTLEEARVLLPAIREITGRAVESAAPIIEKLKAPSLDDADRERLSKELQQEVDAWTGEITRCGAVAKGLWLVDFDSGGGYYCWRYNEESLDFFHGYEEGFGGRVPIQ